MRYLAIFVALIALVAFGCVQETGVSQDYLTPSATAPTASSEAVGGQVIQEGSITIKVAEGTLQSKFDEMNSMLESNGADLSNIRYYEYTDRKAYTVTVKVSPTRFNSINEQLKNIGDVKDMSVNLEDVSQQYKDLDTRIKNREIELQRLYELYNQSSNVSELLQVEQEITRVETDLEILKQQKQDLVSRIEQSTITISLYEDKPATQQLTISLEGLGALFFTALGAAITLIVGIAGFLLPIAIVGAVLWLIYKRVRGKEKPKPRKQEFAQIPSER